PGIAPSRSLNHLVRRAGKLWKQCDAIRAAHVSKRRIVRAATVRERRSCGEPCRLPTCAARRLRDKHSFFCRKLGTIRLAGVCIRENPHDCGRARPMMTTKPGPWSVYEPTAAEPWDLRKVAHLHRRAGFEATWSELQRDLKEGVAASVKR